MQKKSPIGNNFEDPMTWKESGNEFFQKGQYEYAIKCYTHAIELDPDFIEAWNNIGLSLLKLGKIEEAKECNKKIKEIREKIELSKLNKSNTRVEEKVESNSSSTIDLNELKKKYEDGLLSYDQYQSAISQQSKLVTNYKKSEQNSLLKTKKEVTSENSSINSEPSEIDDW